MEKHKENFEINEKDILSIDKYRKKKNTAVLTIMFTDIKGYTRMTEEKGEEYSSKIREIHDTILTSTIEENEAGLIIKFIGDSIMAIFSEPTTAVEKSLLIQEKINAFNKENPDFDDIELRIGLHMGQVALENRIHQDIFGRHVNRASRIESIADGRQIYISYSVFDSAKGWLQLNEHLSWKSHGFYFLKGISDPVEIIEVLPKSQKAVAPKNAKKKRQIPSFVPATMLVLTGVIVTYLFFLFKSTNVYFEKFRAQDVILDNKERLVLDGKAGDPVRKSMKEIEQGKHIIYYDINSLQRYYAEFLVESGDNFILPKFKSVRLPDFNLRYSHEDNLNERITNQNYEYYFYDSEQQKKEINCNIELTIKSALKDEQVYFSISYKIIVNGDERKGQIKAKHDINERKIRKYDKKEIYSDDKHQLEIRYYTTSGTIDFSINGSFLKPSYLF